MNALNTAQRSRTPLRYPALTLVAIALLLSTSFAGTATMLDEIREIPREQLGPRYHRLALGTAILATGIGSFFVYACLRLLAEIASRSAARAETTAIRRSLRTVAGATVNAVACSNALLSLINSTDGLEASPLLLDLATLLGAAGITIAVIPPNDRAALRNPRQRLLLALIAIVATVLLRWRWQA